MSENKRFTTDNGSNEDICLVDNITGNEYESNFDDIVDLLNSLNNENEQLKQQLADEFNQSNCITVQKSKIMDLEKENEQLKSELFDKKLEYDYAKEQVDDAYWELNQLKKENEQLKQQNSRLMMEVAEYSRKVRELKGDVK